MQTAAIIIRYIDFFTKVDAGSWWKVLNLNCVSETKIPYSNH